MIIKLKDSKDPFEWHKWFAWHPVWIDDYHERFFVWLSVVDRRMRDSMAGSWWDRRLLGTKSRERSLTPGPQK